VLLPTSAVGWPDARKRVVLAHELAHIRRRDWHVQLLAEFTCALYWFNPLFWMARNRLSCESERACDDVVLSLGVDGGSYASHLLDIARGTKERSKRLAWTPTLAMARASHLEQRFAALLNEGVNRTAVSRQAAFIAFFALLVVALPVAAIGGFESGSTIEVWTTNLPAIVETTSVSSSRPVTAIKQVRAIMSYPDAVRITAPEVLEYTTPPLYSDDARARHIEGIVTVQARVDMQGTARAVRVVRGLGFGLDQNAVVALRQWRFVPGARNGHPVDMDCEIDVEFNLQTEALNALIANDMATRVGPGVTPPRVVRTVDVAKVADRDLIRAHGTVTLDVVLLEDGTPKIVRILHSLDPALDERAVLAFEQWKFSPAMKDRRPVKVRLQAEVSFRG
jgi:TonB family protein